MRPFAFFWDRSWKSFVYFTFTAHRNWTPHISGTQEPHVLSGYQVKKYNFKQKQACFPLLFFPSLLTEYFCTVSPGTNVGLPLLNNTGTI